MKKLNEIQKKLKAPKNQFNSFGKYNYRSLEDILEAVKPLLGDATLTISDEVVAVGDRIYVKATATLKDKEDTVRATAYAREAIARKGMDDSQLTGATSSYARKYCLNGLFLIDDNKDADTMNGADLQDNEMQVQINNIKTVGALKYFYEKNKGRGAEFDRMVAERKKALSV